VSQGATYHTISPLPSREREGPAPKAWEGEGAPRRLAHAKAMRSKPTEAERRLWSILRSKRLSGFKFKRQQIIGPFIADFVNFERRLIIEADGSQHIENEADLRRTAWLEDQGFAVIRFWNDDVLARTETVADAIWAALHALPLPNPSPARGEGLEGSIDHV
jgi:very-short-patch-repair endonuclease